MFKRLLLALLLAVATVNAADYGALTTLNTSTAQAGVSVRELGSAISYHKLTWNVTGTLSACSVKVEKSPDNATWSDLISAQTCTSNGLTTIVNGTVNYVRINVTTITPNPTGSVYATYTGYINAPAGGGGGAGVAADISFTQGHVALGRNTNSAGTGEEVTAEQMESWLNVVTLVDGATVNTNAALGKQFELTLGGNRTLANPTNAVNGMVRRWVFIQPGAGGPWNITLGSQFSYGTDITGVSLSTTANTRDIMSAIYDSAATKWRIVGFLKGYDAASSTQLPGISVLNGLTTETQSFATGNAGNDFNIDSTTDTHTFNIPDASATARGLVTTGTQTFAGAKTFAGITVTSCTGCSGGSPLTVGNSLVLAYPNASVTGTTVNRLAKITGDPQTAVIAGTSDTTNTIGVVVSGAGTTGTAIIAVMGQAECDFDGSTTAGHYVGVSTGTAGKCTDLGATYPTGVMVIGTVQETGSGAATRITTLFLNDVVGAGGGNGKGQSIQANGTNLPGNIANFNATTPSAGAGTLNVTWQTSQSGNTSRVSAAVSATSLLDILASTNGNMLARSSGTWGAFSGTSGGIPYFSGVTTLASSGALTANLPVIGGGAGTAPSVGTRTGNTTLFATSTGSTSSGKCLEWDANGNIVTAVSGAACGSGSGSGGLPPLIPISKVPVTAGKLWPGIHTSAGSGMKYYEGIQIMASLDADATLALEWIMPQTIPSGTFKLRLDSIANTSSQNAKVQPKWACVSAGADASSATLNDEGVQTIAWGSSQADKYQSNDITLDAGTACTADQHLVMNLVFATSSWTVSAVSTWRMYIVWVP